MFSTSMKRQAYTLIELLVVIAIIGILLGLLLAAVQNVRAAAARTQCQNSLRQIGLALHQYHDSQSTLPTGCGFAKGKHPQMHLSWLARLLPYLEQEALWQQIPIAFQKEPHLWKGPHLPLLGYFQKQFVCPVDIRAAEVKDWGPYQTACTSYLGVSGVNRDTHDGLFYVDASIRFTDITDGLSNTLAVGERPPSIDRWFGWWYGGWGSQLDGSGDYLMGVLEPRFTDRYRGCLPWPYPFQPSTSDDPCGVFHYWSFHSGGANFILADGSVHFVRYSAAPLLPAMATRAGGEFVELP